MTIQQKWKNGIFPKNGQFFQKFFGNFFRSINLEALNMGRVQTSVMIDEDKRALAKQRGIKLQDLLDEALNMALDLEIPGKAQLEIDKDNILKEIEYKEKQKDEYLAKYEKDLEKLEKDKDAYLTMHQQAIDQLNIKLRFSERALAEATEQQKELNQQKEREAIIQRGINAMDIDKQLEADIDAYCLKYKIADWNKEAQDITNEILTEIHKKFDHD